jgi:choline dehydrogenase-like flavoprotein
MPTLAETLRESGALDFSAPRTFDAIVVGTGAAGGVAALNLVRAGLNVLALEAGWEPASPRAAVNHPMSRLFAAISANEAFRGLPPSLINAGRRALKAVGRVRQPVQTKCFAWEISPGSLVDDRDCPYETAPETEFHWFRSRQLGGRMIVPGHGRQYYRFGAGDFEGRGDALAAWPMEAGALDGWYAVIEAALGLRGGNDHSGLVPDARLSVVNTVLPSEAATISAVRQAVPRAEVILGRYAPPVDWMALAAAEGRLTVRTGAVVRRVKVDGDHRVCGAEWLDQRTGAVVSAEAPTVFVCASAFESARILMLSRSAADTERCGLHSDALGRYVMDHVVSSCSGYMPAGTNEADELVEDGRCLYVPMLATMPDASEIPFGVQVHRHTFGSKRARIDLAGFAPMQPRAENRLTLSGRTDRFGMPILSIACRYSDRDMDVAGQQMQAIRAMAGALGMKVDYESPPAATPGTGIHECGTARMGADPYTSVVNPNLECWDTKGLFVTDAAAFPSMGAQNPTLTIMAQTARAAAYVVRRQMRQPATAEATL